jgi:hypothetical protein
LEAAINENPNIPDFIKQFHPPFPVGVANWLGAKDFLQISPTTRTFVPYMVFIDRAGFIQAQHTGEEPYFNEQQDEHIRADVEKLLGGSKKTSSRKTSFIKK